MRNSKFIILLGFILILGCQVQLGAPIESQPNTPNLTTGIDTKNWPTFESQEHGIGVGYPQDWYIKSDEIFITTQETPISLLSNGCSSIQPAYQLYMMGPYVERSERRFRIPQTSIKVAEKVVESIMSVTTSELIQPPTSVNINGRDGAIFVTKDNNDYTYTIILRISQDKAVVLFSCGQINGLEEIQSTLNAIALSVYPIDGE